jgi:hypothetical protein
MIDTTTPQPNPKPSTPEPQPIRKGLPVLAITPIVLGVMGAIALHLSVSFEEATITAAWMYLMVGGMLGGAVFCLAGVLLAVVGMVRKSVSRGMVAAGVLVNLATLGSFVLRWMTQPG